MSGHLDGFANRVFPWRLLEITVRYLTVIQLSILIERQPFEMQISVG